ncbi:MAG TPA: PilZ domain-containing protein [Pyrinomonadaceae bacterium]|nr:PilZ domain-containing protein [Chloracidobacterium sp.]MBP9934615.1 PilZ domain-containing protein [Pyrinomonadaceae bacterium]MBK9438995.1 PilZ domain-containing protein [Chloracidobacterium sp.]MBL0240599.1 PilZ domain-containing protein [Chloracidobacterium sp.]HQX55693.1 PilZ domain-containing protein [Pyrinomonadaceae bacterium]
MEHPNNEKRTAERSSTQLRTLVQVKEADDVNWKEITNVTTVSRNGAGFTLSRRCSVGRLISLVLPMPVEYRAYDHKAKVYPVLGLVQYCNAVEKDGFETFHIGVGFIGKDVPESYKADPLQGYRITGVTDSGLWKFTESESAFKPRQTPRLWASVDVTISLIKKDRLPSDKETAVTNNISAKGLSAICKLSAEIGDRVKLACKEYDFYAIAIVRNCKPADNGNSIHLEFLENSFPMEKLYAERAAAIMQAREALAESAEPVAEAKVEEAKVEEPQDEPADESTPIAADYSSAGFELLRY